MKTVFISYRRADSAGYTRSMYNSLTQTFSDQQIFMDVDDIKAGTDFVSVLEERLENCEVLLVMIGKHWLDIRDEQGQPRLDNPQDWVRTEIATALKRNLRVIPILIEGATMPKEEALPDELKPLVRRQALMLSNYGFNYQISHIISVISELIPVEKNHTATQDNQEKPALSPSHSPSPKTDKVTRSIAKTKNIAKTLKSFFMWIGIIVFSLLMLAIFYPQPNPESTHNNQLNLSGIWYNDAHTAFTLEHTDNYIRLSSPALTINGMKISGEINGQNIRFMYTDALNNTAFGSAIIENDRQHISGHDTNGAPYRLHREHLPQH